MISRSTLLHLRIPFSFYLMPVFFFAANRPMYVSDAWHIYFAWVLFYPLGYLSLILRYLVVFISIHLFLYPASNGFNSYYDKDEEAIGGLENPPPVSNQLLYVSLIFDLIAVLLGLLIRWEFACMLFIYGLVSKAYSHPAIRLKRHGNIAWLTAGVFQGGFTFLMVAMGLQNHGFEELTQNSELIQAGVATLMILGFYPLTQIYQHEEDRKHGDNTISRIMGIKGTFRLSLAMFFLADIMFYIIYKGDYFFSIPWFWILQLFFAPIVIYFLWWFYNASRDKTAANFKNTMRMNKIASLCLVSFFIFYGISPLIWHLIKGN